MLQELVEVVLCEINPRLLVLLNLLQYRLVFTVHFVICTVELFDAFLVVLLCHLALVLGINAVIHDILDFLVRDLILLPLQ